MPCAMSYLSLVNVMVVGWTLWAKQDHIIYLNIPQNTTAVNSGNIFHLIEFSLKNSKSRRTHEKDS